MHILRDGATLVQIGCTRLLLDANGGRYYILNRTAYEMLRVILASETLEAGMTQLTGIMDAESKTIRADLFELLHNLDNIGIVDPSSVTLREATS